MQDAQELPRAAVDVGRFRFTGFHGCESWCRIRIYPRPDGEPPVVIATEAEDNPGTSITNAAELIATEVQSRHRLAELVWIEHYDHRAPHTSIGELRAQPERSGAGRKDDPQTFDLVEFDRRGFGFRSPKWTRLTRVQVLNLIGEAPTPASWGMPRGASRNRPRLSHEERRRHDWTLRYWLTSGLGGGL